ncbi:MAG: hypothetical protein J5850_02945, partial [Clostridia bacterium]|nr:hypothetical protein [Clostridia bacterium]
MEYKPRKNRKNGIVITISLLIISFIFYLSLALDWGIRIVNQVGMIVTAAIGIFVLSRYVLTDYVYKINENGYLTIHRVYGRSTRLLADIKISQTDRVVIGKKEISGLGKIDIKENYSSSLFPESVNDYLYYSGGKKVLLVLEGGQDLYAA